MARVVVAGMAECSRFAHVDFFAEHLSNTLPDFQYQRIVISRYEWPAYVTELNKKHGWSIVKSPIVWREPGISGGKAYLVGSASEFWEYVHKYYGLLSNITSEEGDLLAQDLYQKFLDDEMETKQRENRQRHRHVTISGASHPMTSLLVSELLKIPALQMELGVFVTLFDREGDISDLREIALDARGVGFGAGLKAVRVAESVHEAFDECDLIIILDACKRNEGEELRSWLRRNQELMISIGYDLNRHAPDKCRVVYAGPHGPACFNATVLADEVIDIAKYNVVAVTADLGIEARHALSNVCEVPLSKIYSPPVWGFVGLNQNVDLFATRHSTEQIVPNNRPPKPGRKTMPSTPITEPVILPISHRLEDTDGLWQAVAKDKEEALDEMQFAKVKATCDMLGLWFRDPVPVLKNASMRFMFRLRRVTAETFKDKGASSLPKGIIISLGILSNGAFEIPEGLNFSQQVCLQNGRWVPYEPFPIPKDRYVKLKELFNFPCALLKELNVGRNLNADYLLDDEDLAEKKKAVIQRKNKREMQEIEQKNNIQAIRKAKERETKIQIRRKTRQMERECEVMIRDDIVARTMRELIENVLDACVPYPEKVEVVFKRTDLKQDELAGEGGEDQQPEEEEERKDDDEDYGDEVEDEEDEDDDD